MKALEIMLLTALAEALTREEPECTKLVHSFPEPEREPPEVGAAYYIPVLDNKNLTSTVLWEDDDHDHLWLKRGLIHLTRESAKAHARSIIALAGGEV